MENWGYQENKSKKTAPRASLGSGAARPVPADLLQSLSLVTEDDIKEGADLVIASNCK